MINYKLVPNLENSFTSCYEAAVSSIIYNLFPNYDSIFTMYWGFEYYKNSDENEFIGNRFVVGGRYLQDRDKYLSDLFGISFTEKKFTHIDMLIEVLQNELKQQKTLILSIDTYDCPWNIGYQRFHLEHFIVITGYHPNMHLFFCHDSFCGKENESLPRSAILHMQQFHVYTYNVDEKRRKNLKNEDLFIQAAAYYLNQECSFLKLYEFAEELQDVNLYNELAEKDLSIIGLQPFFVKFNGIVSSRKNLLFFLNHKFANKFNEIKVELKEIGKLYHDAYLLLLKSVSRRGNPEYMHHAADFIKQGALREKKIAQHVLYQSDVL